MNILLIEDDSDYAETLNDIFSVNSENKFIWVESFEETEKAFSNRAWDIVLSDIHLDFHPERIFELHKNSKKNFDTPLIFLTAERETNLANELIDKGDYPVISKFEIDEDILTIAKNYTELFRLIKKQDEENEQISFRRFITRYINEKRYKYDQLSSSLAGWLDQEKTIFSNLKKNAVADLRSQNSKLSNFKSGFVRVSAKDFLIKDYSPSIEILSNQKKINGELLEDTFNSILDSDKLYKELNDYIAGDSYGVHQFTLSERGTEGNILLKFSIRARNVENINERVLDVEITKSNSFGFEWAELLNLKEANKVLSQEIHHRVNNNLNVIISLLNLKLMNVDENESLVYHTILEQLVPITAAYQLLFATKKVSTVKVKDYIEALNREIFRQHQHLETIEEIEFEDEQLALNLNQLIYVGLLLYELHETYKNRNLKVKLTVKNRFDVINLIFHAKNLAAVLDRTDSLVNQQDAFILNAYLNKLNALISSQGNNKIVIRFKKITKKGGASNIVD